MLFFIILFTCNYVSLCMCVYFNVQVYILKFSLITIVVIALSLYTRVYKNFCDFTSRCTVCCIGVHFKLANHIKNEHNWIIYVITKSILIKKFYLMKI